MPGIVPFFLCSRPPEESFILVPLTVNLSSFSLNILGDFKPENSEEEWKKL